MGRRRRPPPLRHLRRRCVLRERAAACHRVARIRTARHRLPAGDVAVHRRACAVARRADGARRRGRKRVLRCGDLRLPVGVWSERCDGHQSRSVAPATTPGPGTALSRDRCVLRARHREGSAAQGTASSAAPFPCRSTSARRSRSTHPSSSTSPCALAPLAAEPARRPARRRRRRDRLRRRAHRRSGHRVERRPRARQAREQVGRDGRPDAARSGHRRADPLHRNGSGRHRPRPQAAHRRPAGPGRQGLGPAHVGRRARHPSGARRLPRQRRQRPSRARDRRLARRRLRRASARPCRRATRARAPGGSGAVRELAERVLRPVAPRAIRSRPAQQPAQKETP